MRIADAKVRLRIPELWSKLELPGQPGGSCRSPFRDDNHPSFVIYEDGFRYYDHGEGKGGDAVDFLQRATGLSKPGAYRKFVELAENLAGCSNPTTHSSRASQPQSLVSVRPAKEKLLSRIDNLPRFVPELDTSKNHHLLDRLARQRNVSGQGVWLAHQRGLLEFCFLKMPGYCLNSLEWCPESHEPAWAVLDRTRYNVQVRWLDGTRFGREAHSPKAKTWPGSGAKWPIGIYEALTYPIIMLVEGGPDLLAAHHFVNAMKLEHRVGVIAMLGARLSIHAAALPLLNAKRVRIIPHFDDPGREAAQLWGAQLEQAGAEVDAFSLDGLEKRDGHPVKDLNDCCELHADDAAQLEGLFTL